MSSACGICGDHLKRGDEGSVVIVKEKLQELDLAVQECHTLERAVHDKLRVRDSGNTASARARYIELHNEREMLKARLSKLREDSAINQAKVDQQQEQLRARKSELAVATEAHQIAEFAVEGLKDALCAQTEELYILRMQVAVRVFTAVRIEANPPPRARKPGRGDRTREEIQLTGCSSILSLPVPNSGNFSGVPVDAVTAAVAHIAHLVDAVSAALHVPLPHPIYPFETADCLISAQHDIWARAQVRACCYSLAPVTYLNDRTRHRDFDWTTLQELSDCSNTQRGRKTTGNTLNTNSRQRGECDLPVVLKNGPDDEVVQYSVNPNFGTAVVLLQANIVELCLRVGLQVEELWPPEAMLFNLHLLQKRCEGVVLRNKHILRAVNAGDIPDRPVAMYADLPLASRAYEEDVLSSVADRYGSAAKATASTRERAQEEELLQADPAVSSFVTQFEGEEHEWDVVTLLTSSALDQTQIL